MLGPSCREVAERVGRDELDSLGRWDRLLTRMHLALCRHCRSYAAQLRTIGRVARSMYRGDPVDESTISRLEETLLADLAGRASGGAAPVDGDPPARPPAI